MIQNKGHVSLWWACMACVYTYMDGRYLCQVVPIVAPNDDDSNTETAWTSKEKLNTTKHQLNTKHFNKKQTSFVTNQLVKNWTKCHAKWVHQRLDLKKCCSHGYEMEMEIPSLVQGLSLEVGKGPKESTRLKPHRNWVSPHQFSDFNLQRGDAFSLRIGARQGTWDGFLLVEIGGKNNSGKRCCPEKRGEKRQWSLTWNGVSTYKNMEAGKKKQNKSWMGLWRRVNTEEVSRLGNRWQHHLSKERMSLCLYIFRGCFHSLQGWECRWISVWSGFLLKVFFGGFLGMPRVECFICRFFSHQNSRQNVCFFFITWYTWQAQNSWPRQNVWGFELCAAAPIKS